MKKALFLTLPLLLLGGIQTSRVARADDAEIRLCQQAAEEVKKTQEFMERAAPRIFARADYSVKAFFCPRPAYPDRTREALSNRRCRTAWEFNRKARRLTLITWKRCEDTSPDGTIPTPE